MRKRTKITGEMMGAAMEAGGLKYRLAESPDSPELNAELNETVLRLLRTLTGITLPLLTPIHPAGLRCSSLAYSRYARSSRLAGRAPRRPRWHTYSDQGPYGRVGRGNDHAGGIRPADGHPERNGVALGVHAGDGVRVPA